MQFPRKNNFFRNPLFLVALLFAVVLIAGFFLLEQRPSFAESLSELNVEFENVVGATFTRKDISQDGEGNLSLLIGVNEDTGEQIAVQSFPQYENQVDALSDEQKLFESIFDIHRVSYPEFVTREIECPERFLPISHEHPFGEYFITFATERLGYGACTDDSAAYRAGVGFFYCPATDTAVRVDITAPLGENAEHTIQSLFEGFVCL